MIGLAITTVHTSGVNWVSIVTIGIMTVGIVGAFSRWIISRLDSIRDTVVHLDLRLTRVEDQIKAANGRHRRWWR